MRTFVGCRRVCGASYWLWTVFVLRFVVRWLNKEDRIDSDMRFATDVADDGPAAGGMGWRQSLWARYLALLLE